ncbi:hypothetical protein [Brachyspira alvinipulli]|uniref:hypothetical protein n=1 Tax=Brachyspira alvinipulli TaxID=84379 RepID=UPI00047F40DD|nr:hypothetical protein [Brachyspira alvinipulli]
MKYKIKVKNKYISGINRMIIFTIKNNYNRPKDIFKILKLFYRETLIHHIDYLLNADLLCIKKINGIGGIYLNRDFDGEYFHLNIEDNDINSSNKEYKRKLIKNNLTNKSIIKILNLKDIIVC